MLQAKKNKLPKWYLPYISASARLRQENLGIKTIWSLDTVKPCLKKKVEGRR